MSKRPIVSLAPFAAATAAALLLAACGGGGASGTGGAPGIPSTTQSSPSHLGLTVGTAPGSSLPFSVARQTMSNGSSSSASGTAVSVTYNGSTVATGTLDSNGFADLTFSQSIPAGAVLTVTIGSGSTAIVVTVTVASAVNGTSADVTYSAGPPPSVTVASAADDKGDGKVDPSDASQETESENPSDGQATNVNSNDNGLLPSNLPIVISACSTTLTLTPAAGAPPNLSLNIEEKQNDSENAAQFEQNVPTFDGPVSVPILAASARLDLTLSSNGQEILSIEAPLTAVTAQAGSPAPSTTCAPSPSPSPSASPSAMPSASPSASPSAMPSASPSAAPSASPSAMPSASPSAMPSASPSAAPSASPSASPSATATP